MKKTRIVRLLLISIISLIMIMGCESDKGQEISSKMSDGSDRFIANGDGTVLDKKTNLMWAAKDNDAPITWHDAKKFVESYNGGGHTDWRMPKQDELKELYVRGNRNKHGASIISLVEVTAMSVWSEEFKDGKGGCYIFSYGAPYFTTPRNTGRYRALPVRAAN